MLIGSQQQGLGLVTLILLPKVQCGLLQKLYQPSET